ncbi:MAG: DUF167 family protein [Steroidobacteraceae bacterium]
MLELHVQPGARRDEIVGAHGERLKLKLASPAVDGKANRHLMKWLATLFDVPTGQVQLLRGTTGRMKTVLIEGATELPPALTRSPG